MYLSRYFEERVQWMFTQGLVHGTTHLGIGEEATAAGSIYALKKQDYLFGTHRGHNQAICKGIDLNCMMAEIRRRRRSGHQRNTGLRRRTFHQEEG